MKSIIRKNAVYYIIGIAILTAVKYYYGNAGTESLIWILDPTCRWTEILSGIEFQRELQIGFVSHSHGIVVNASCAGVNFLVILFAALYFSLVHRFNRMLSKLSWLLFSLLASYPATIAVNGIRIIAAVYLREGDVYGGWFTPDRVHRLTGIIVYLVSLIVIHNTVRMILLHIKRRAGADGGPKGSGKAKSTYAFLLPVFWYLAVTIGIPLLNRSTPKDRMFLEHSAVVLAVCAGGSLIFWLVFLLANAGKSSAKANQK